MHRVNVATLPSGTQQALATLERVFAMGHDEVLLHENDRIIGYALSPKAIQLALTEHLRGSLSAGDGGSL